MIFTLVYSSLPLFYPCLPLYIHIYRCLLMFTRLPMFTNRGVARLTLMVGAHIYHTAHLLLLLSNGMLVHTCIYLWDVLKSAKYE